MRVAPIGPAWGPDGRRRRGRGGNPLPNPGPGRCILRLLAHVEERAPLGAVAGPRGATFGIAAGCIPRRGASGWPCGGSWSGAEGRQGSGGAPRRDTPRPPMRPGWRGVQRSQRDLTPFRGFSTAKASRQRGVPALPHTITGRSVPAGGSGRGAEAHWSGRGEEGQPEDQPKTTDTAPDATTWRGSCLCCRDHGAVRVLPRVSEAIGRIGRELGR